MRTMKLLHISMVVFAVCGGMLVFISVAQPGSNLSVVYGGMTLLAIVAASLGKRSFARWSLLLGATHAFVTLIAEFSKFNRSASLVLVVWVGSTLLTWLRTPRREGRRRLFISAIEVGAIIATMSSVTAMLDGAVAPLPIAASIAVAIVMALGTRMAENEEGRGQ